MRESVRTVILILLLIIAVGFIYWTQNNYEANFVETL
jgi:lipopolysaccharide export system protein LptC